MTCIERRKFLIGLTGLVAVWPRPGLAQTQPKRPLIGWIAGVTPEFGAGTIREFLKGMQQYGGYVEGKDFDLVPRFSSGYQDRLPALAEELVQLKPDVIVAVAVIGAVAVRKVTKTIPIVTPALADAVELGLIESVRRPGGNVTGIEPYLPGLPAKQMELVREILPNARKVGLLSDLTDPKVPPQVVELEGAGRAVHIDVVAKGVNRPNEIEGALEGLANERVDVVIVLQSSMFLSESRRIADISLAKRLPTVNGYPQHVVAGGLISYGIDLNWCFQRGAYFVDRILRGEKPADLPVEFPTKMLLALNMKTTKALGLEVPPIVQFRVDQLIE
jgi:ABC-type uncharacterized transport system substrate-binding protein